MLDVLKIMAKVMLIFVGVLLLIGGGLCTIMDISFSAGALAAVALGVAAVGVALIRLGASDRFLKLDEHEPGEAANNTGETRD